MLKIRTVSLLLTPLVLCSPVGGARGSTGPRSDKPDAAQQEEYRLLSVRGTVWRVFPSGRVERLSLPGAEDKRWAGDIDKGTTAPVPSPDQRYVAYARALDVWLYDLAADSARRLTSMALPGNDTTAATFVWITGWSPTGERLLVYLDHEEVEDPESYRPNLAVQAADYGYYSCDVPLARCSRVTLPGNFQTWLPSGEYLLSTDEPVPTERRLIRYDARTGKALPLSSGSGWFLQIDVARNADRALTSVMRGSGGNASTQVLALDLNSGSLTPVTNVGSLGEYQWAQYSPSANRVAYLRRVGREQGTIVVDGRPVYRCESLQGSCRAHWINEQVLAVEEIVIVLRQALVRSQTLRLTVLDVGTGQVRAVDTLGVDLPAGRR